MHRIAFAIAVVLVAGWLCKPAFATGNVLVPSDNASDDLGYAAPRPSLPPDMPSDLPALDSAPQQTPPTQHASTLPSNTVANKPAEGQEASSAQQIIEMPVLGGQSTPDDASLPNTLTIDLGDNSRWGSVDTSTIRNAIGISPDAVPKHCRLSVGGIANSTSNVGIYSFDTGTVNTALLHYDGKLTGMTVRLQALCDPVPLPPDARFVMKVGDDYSVFLTQMTCSTPPENVQHLTVSYSGNGSGKCVYE